MIQQEAIAIINTTKMIISINFKSLLLYYLIAKKNHLQIFSAADLQEKGKAGYQAVFNTLMQLSLKAQSIFEQKVIHH